eukprot:g26180.t1
MCQEMGKPLAQGKAEVMKCAYLVDWYAENGAEFLKDTEYPALPGFQKSFVTYQPLGLILSIMPWNFPMWQVTNKVLEHPSIQGVALTGSEVAGRAAVVELGGSDAYAILADCDLDMAAEAVVNARVANSGQTCIAPKRAIVEKSVKAAFEQKVVEKISRKKYGVDYGPLVHPVGRDQVAKQVVETQSQGAKLLCGGPDVKVPTSDCGKSFFPPTVLTDVRPGMTAFETEIFGPVISIIEAEDELEVIRLANQTHYGLAGAIFTSDLQKGERMAVKDIDAGMCFVNDFVRSDPSLPFGGVKSSGLGRECAAFGMLEFVNVKTICVNGFVTHWTSEGRPLESVNELLHFYVRRLSRVLVTFWLAMLWAVYLQHKNGQELQVDYVVRCLCLVEQWVHWCPNGPSWFVFALLPSWILYPLTRKLAFLFLSSAGPAVYLLLVHGNITMQEHSDMTFWPPSQMSDFVLGMTTAALVRRGGKYLHFLADFSLLVVVLVVFLLPRPATTWALHLNGWEPMLDHGLAPLLAAFILGSCADRERPGWCARLLAHPALVSLGEMSFEVYIFQRPVHDTFELFTATDEMDVQHLDITSPASQTAHLVSVAQGLLGLLAGPLGLCWRLQKLCGGSSGAVPAGPKIGALAASCAAPVR